MNGDVISKEEALNLIKRVVGVPMQVFVYPGGDIWLEFGEIKDVQNETVYGESFTTHKGEYSISIKGNWVIDSGKVQKYFNDYTSLRDEEKLQKFLNATSLAGIDWVDKMNIMSFVFNNEKKIHITSNNPTDLCYFSLFFNNSNDKKYLCLSQDFKFRIISPDESTFSIVAKRIIKFLGI